jgi:hypothetical protein
VFLHFRACERGKTPSFACGPFDSLDAVTAARLRDGYQVELVLREEANPPLPQDPWSEISSLPEADRAAAMPAAIFAAWRGRAEFDNLGRLKNRVEHVVGQDPTALFLARMIIPADEPAADGTPLRRLNEAPVIYNDLREFVVTANALAAMLGITLSGG